MKLLNRKTNEEKTVVGSKSNNKFRYFIVWHNAVCHINRLVCVCVCAHAEWTKLRMQSSSARAGHFIVLTFHCCQLDCGVQTSQQLNRPKCSFWPCQTHDLDIFRAALQLVNNQMVGQSANCFTNCILSTFSVICRRSENTPNYFIYRDEAASSSLASTSSSGSEGLSFLIITNWMHDHNRSRQWKMELLGSRSTIVIFWSISLRFIGVLVWFTLASWGRIKIMSKRNCSYYERNGTERNAWPHQDPSPINLTYWNVFVGVYMFCSVFSFQVVYWMYDEQLIEQKRRLITWIWTMFTWTINDSTKHFINHQAPI